MATRRRALAIAWMSLVATAIVGHLAHEPIAVLFAWFTALMLTPFTTALGDTRADERLELPVSYRAVAAVALALPLAGVLLLEVPDASAESYLFAPYFAVMAIVGYRVLVARGPRRALRATVLSLLVWPPFAMFLFMGCRCGHVVPPPPHWTELASEGLLYLTQVVDGALCAVALLAFAPRHELVPEARIA
jgi:hypothetical protein